MHVRTQRNQYRFHPRSMKPVSSQSVQEELPFGRCPICRLPLVQSTTHEDEAVCDSSHRYRYQSIDTPDGTEYHLGRYVGKDQ